MIWQWNAEGAVISGGASSDSVSVLFFRFYNFMAKIRFSALHCPIPLPPLSRTENGSFMRMA